MVIWNPWHGCRRYSEGCQHCYMYALDSRRDIDPSIITLNDYETYTLPISKSKGEYKLRPGMELFVGLSTDFFIEDADDWRGKCWDMIRQRKDVAFRITTKRISRVEECLPKDWGDGYENVMIQVTTENQKRADERLPILMDLPAKHKSIFVAPMLEEVHVEKYLPYLDLVMCGGENYDGSRLCDYKWVKCLSDQCREANVTFNLIETGNNFRNEHGIIERVNKEQQSERAQNLGVNYIGKPYKYNLVFNDLFGDLNYNPYFAKRCDRCSSKMTCNGCGKGLSCKRNCP